MNEENRFGKEGNERIRREPKGNGRIRREPMGNKKNQARIVMKWTKIEMRNQRELKVL